MKNILNKLTILTTVVVILSCVDESLDPFRIDSLIKGSILALRGDAVDRLNDTGCSNSFFKDQLLASDAFTFDADFLSEDQSLLESVQMFVRVDPADPDTDADLVVARTPLPTASGTAGSAFVVPSGGNYKQGTISISRADIQAACGFDPAQMARLGQFEMTIEADHYTYRW